MHTVDRYKETREILTAILRYPRRRPMFYRSNVALHEQRVRALAREAFPFFRTQSPEIDQKRLEAIAEIHDDLELVTYPDTKELPTEDSLRKRKAELSDARKLNGHYLFNRNGIEARTLLTIYFARHFVEAQLVEYLDIFDGFGEAVHEVSAGNDHFLDLIEIQRKRLKEIGQHREKLQPFIDKDYPLFTLPEFSYQQLRREPHTEKSLAQATGYAPYDFWRKALICSGTLETYESLFEQKESKTGKPKALVTGAYNEAKFQISSPI